MVRGCTVALCSEPKRGPSIKGDFKRRGHERQVGREIILFVQIAAGSSMYERWGITGGHPTGMVRIVGRHLLLVRQICGTFIV